MVRSLTFAHHDDDGEGAAVPDRSSLFEPASPAAGVLRILREPPPRMDCAVPYRFTPGDDESEACIRITGRELAEGRAAAEEAAAAEKAGQKRLREIAKRRAKRERIEATAKILDDFADGNI